MRISAYLKDEIINASKIAFGECELILFGSRVDDSKRGGDIDLYIDLEERLPYSVVFSKKIDFLVALKEKIGEQKIDVVISKDKSRSIEQEALKYGIKL